jgi:hypothetical protein
MNESFFFKPKKIEMCNAEIPLQIISDLSEISRRYENFFGLCQRTSLGAEFSRQKL